MKRRIRLRGINGDIEGKTWESDNILRFGRLATLEIVLDDTSVSRRHAEVRSTANGWRIRDLGSTNGTFLNGNRLGPGEWPVRLHDILRCGNVTLVVDMLKEGREEDDTQQHDNLMVEASACNSWEDAVAGLAYDRNRCPRPGEQMIALLRAGRHLMSIEKEDDLLHMILNDAVSSLDAQRGAIVLAETPNGPLKLRALASGHSQLGSRTAFSQNLAQRSFSRGESILCTSVEEDPELMGARSIAEGTMASVLCVLLRTPRKRLGVLHLDRGPMQKPFTKDDLHLADALAAHVSAGIECAQLLAKQRQLFLATITTLADAVELRDKYTGNHTKRVTNFSILLAEQLDLPSDDIEILKIGTPLHDVGKIGIPDDILKKPGKLTNEEFEIMKTHTVKGAEILGQVPDPAAAVPIARSHHERWDGRGYPDALRGEDIPRLARIVAVADAFDAMTSDRPYRQGMAPEVAFAEVEKQRGRQFDPEAATAFLQIRQRVIEEMQLDTKRIERLPGQAISTLRLASGA